MSPGTAGYADVCRAADCTPDEVWYASMDAPRSLEHYLSVWGARRAKASASSSSPASATCEAPLHSGGNSRMRGDDITLLTINHDNDKQHGDTHTPQQAHPSTSPRTPDGRYHSAAPDAADESPVCVSLVSWGPDASAESPAGVE